MQLAANTLGSALGDNLAAITPAGANTWQASFPSPSTGAEQTVTNLAVPANTIIVYVGGRPLPSQGEAGDGSTGGFTANGDQNWLNTVAARGQTGALAAVPTDYGPWGGSIAFGTSSTNWFFGTTTAGFGPTQTDFLTVAEHELGHVLGIGTSNSWAALAQPVGFVGRSAEAVNGGQPVALDPGLAHWAEGTMSDGHPATMDPVLVNGTRELFTTLDFAGLEDVGWQVQSPVVQLSVAGASVAENAGSVTLNVTRAGGQSSFTVVYSTFDGTARAGVDYTKTFGILSFAVGQASATVTVPILGDPTPDGNETFYLGLSAPTAGAVIGSQASEVVTIDDFAGIYPPNAPALSPASDTGVSASDGITRNNGSPQAPLTLKVSGVSPANGYVRLLDVTNPNAPVVLAGPTQAAGGAVTFTLSGTPLADGARQFAATTALTPTGPTSANSAATSVSIQTSLSVLSTSPANGATVSSLLGGQVVVTFSHWLAGFVDGASAVSAAHPFPVTLGPQGPDGTFAAPFGIDRGSLSVHVSEVYHNNPDGTSSIVLTPYAPMSTDVYAISVGAGLTDLAGNPIGGTAFTTFVYRPVTNAVAPAVTSVSSYNGFQPIANNVIYQPDTIAIAFNKPLDILTVNQGTVHLFVETPSGLLTEPTAVAYSPTTQSVYLTPEAPLFPGNVYLIAVESAVTDDQSFPNPGTPMARAFYTTFSVWNGPAGAGQGPLRVLQDASGAPVLSPAAGKVVTTPFGYASVAFTEPISLASMGRYSATLVSAAGGLNPTGLDTADPALNARLAFNPNTNQLIIVPTQPVGNDLYLYALGGIFAAKSDMSPNWSDPLQTGGPGPYYATFMLAAPASGFSRASSVARPLIAAPAATVPAVPLTNIAAPRGVGGKPTTTVSPLGANVVRIARRVPVPTPVSTRPGH